MKGRDESVTLFSGFRNQNRTATIVLVIYEQGFRSCEGGRWHQFYGPAAVTDVTRLRLLRLSPDHTTRTLSSHVIAPTVTMSWLVLWESGSARLTNHSKSSTNILYINPRTASSTFFTSCKHSTQPYKIHNKKICANPLRLSTVLSHHMHRNWIGKSEPGRHWL